ncbi:TetR/AcrR family transcriptional regulator [Scrofimicrobium sp. R131]|uniref:TetR/AcrR family transcriptional regulator n=1 Tax=Scrofimicrobium appendicitidis TaxID=3079930 RepID=A0AAU7V9R1_9ACTO
MGRSAGRTPVETRRQILDAAARIIRRRGLATPVSEVAAEAGVSKGGLLYHFPSKEELLQGLAVDLVKRFRTEVEAAIDHDDPRPGRVARAYLQVSFADSIDTVGLRDEISLAAHLMDSPSLHEILQSDSEQWRREIEADGLDPAVTRVVIAASDGINIGPLWGPILSEEDTRKLAQDLIELTYRGTL